MSKRFEYKVICPDTGAGYYAIFKSGEEGWEACASWVEEIWTGGLTRRVNHILFKREVETKHEHEWIDVTRSPTIQMRTWSCRCGAEKKGMVP